jgi:uncharacterized protein (DUF1501 family)
MISRRDWIRIGAASAGSLALKSFGLLPALAQSGTDYRALVVIFLFGGNDSNNTVLPMDDANYQAYMAARGNLALTGSALTAPVADTTGAPYAFHAKLTELAGLFTSRNLAVVANVGSLIQPLTRAQYQAQNTPIPLNLFSHSDQQIQWQTSVAQGHSATGWGGRAADYIAAQKINSSDFPTFISLAGNSLEGTGAQTQPVAVAPGQSLQLTGFNNSAASRARLQALNTLLSTPNGVMLSQAANDTLAHAITDAAALSTALARATPTKTTFPTTSIGSQLKQVAQIIQVHADLGMSRQIFFCSLGGFDTHTNEIATHDNLYPQLSSAVAAFYEETQQMGLAQNVTTFTESDFSRTFQPTTGGGSDHAWGGNHLVIGGAVLGGRIYGKFPTFQLAGPDDADIRGRWVPTTSIDQCGATLCSWFGLPDTALAAVFPNLANFATKNLGFLG